MPPTRLLPLPGPLAGVATAPWATPCWTKPGALRPPGAVLIGCAFVEDPWEWQEPCWRHPHPNTQQGLTQDVNTRSIPSDADGDAIANSRGLFFTKPHAVNESDPATDVYPGSEHKMEKSFKNATNATNADKLTRPTKASLKRFRNSHQNVLYQS
jgi:hypothetical protein